jgi:hypothetical protein
MIRAASPMQQRVVRAIEGRREFSYAWKPAVAVLAGRLPAELVGWMKVVGVRAFGQLRGAW